MFMRLKRTFVINNETDEETANSLIRIYCFLGALLIPVFLVLNFGRLNVFDFICLSTVSLLFLFVFVFSSRFFTLKIIREKLSDIAFGIYLLISIYAIYATYRKNFSVDYSFALTILFFVFGIALRSARHIFLYFSITAAIGGIAIGIAESPQISASFLVSFFLIFFCTGFFSMRYKAGILEKLEQRENFLKTLFNQTYDAILLVDFYSRIVVDCNDASVRLFEVFDKNEIIGNERDQFEVNKMSEKELVQCRRELAQNGIWRNETSYITKKGKQFWGEIVITPLNMGSTQYYVARINDITAGRIAKEALRENEERYRTIFKRNPQPVWIYDKHTLEFIDVNEEAIRFYGYSHAEFMKMTVPDMHPGKEEKHLPEFMKDLKADYDKGRYSGDWKHLKKDGTEIDVEIVSTKINLQGREAYLAIIKDVTSIREAEKSLQESEESFRRLSEITTEAIAIHEKGKILEINSSFCRLFGFPENEIIGKSASDFADPDSRDRLMKNILNDYERPFEVTGQRKDGTKFIGELTGKKIMYKNREVRVTIFRDITEQRNAEKILRESEERLNNFMNSATDVFALYDENLNFLEINDAGLKLINEQNKSGIIGKNIAAVFPGISKEYHIEKYNEVIRTGISIRVENFIDEQAGGKILLAVIAFKVGSGLGIIARDVTEKRKTETRLIESEKNYRQLVEHSPDGILIMKLNRVLYANKTALQIFGVKSHFELVNIFDVIHPDYHELSKERWEKAMEGKEVSFAEIKIKKKDGTVVEVESKPSIVTYLGKPAMQVALHDLTQRKLLIKERVRAEIAEETTKQLQKEIRERLKVEKQLIESQKYTRSLIDSSLDMIVASDTEGNIFEFNDAAAKTFGYEKEEVLGKQVSFLYGFEEDHVTMKRHLAEGNGTFSGEIINKRKNGEHFISFLSASVLRDENGKVFGFMGVSRDITKFKLAENALKESHQFVDSVIENIPNMIFVKDAKDLRFVRFNKAGEELLGIKREELLGKNDYDFFPRAQADFFIQKDRETLSKKKLEDIPEEPISTKYRGQRILHTKKIPIFDEKGNPKYLLGISEDITEMKEAEELIIKSLQEKEILLKEIHHRVKNNMQVISSILNLQSAYTKDKNTLEILKESQNRIKTMALIHESLYQTNDFSKIDFSEYILNLSDNLIYSYRVSDTHAALETDIEKNVILNIDRAIPSGLIINELISNAFKHAFNKSAGNRKKIIQLKLKGNRKISIEVSDNGIGLPEHIDYRKTETLGLQLVSTLVEQLGGEIKVERNNGTKFLVSFSLK